MNTDVINALCDSENQPHQWIEYPDELIEVLTGGSGAIVENKMRSIIDDIPTVITEDRSKIHTLIEEMLDNPDKHGVYPTTRTYNRFEKMFAQIRAEAVGWAWAEACIQLDNGKDPRQYPQGELVLRSSYDLNKESATRKMIFNKWVIIHPLVAPFIVRLKNAWRVLVGRADAVEFYKQ